MRTPAPITIDFETQAIEGRPAYPPEPVGVSIMWPGEKAKYYAWGHPAKNNCSEQVAFEALRACWTSAQPLLFHNAKFDYDVAVSHCGLPHLPWERLHDTLYLLFLVDPYASSFSLKPAAERHLGLPPTEQEAVRDWLVDQGVVKRSDRKWGAHIAKAPGDLVGKYAKGDVERTYKLFRKLYPMICNRGMLTAYDRERQLMPILLRNETDGIRVDAPLLAADVVQYTAALAQAEAWLRKKFKIKDLNFDAHADVAEALARNGIVTQWETTKTGKRSTAKKTLTQDKFSDPRIWLVLGYRNKLAKCLNTYMLPWAKTADASKGRIFIGWNQVRQSEEWGAGDNFGARTGRPSASPNLLAVTKSFYDRGDGYTHPKFVKNLPDLPTIRRYLLPDEGQVFVHRDYNQQELRILAHFEDAGLCKAYNDHRDLDVHTFVQQRIREVTGTEYPRRHVKTLNFGMLYGMGIARLAETLGLDIAEAKAMKQAQRRALSGLADLEWDLKTVAKDDGAIRTWGGREYYCEPPKEVDGVYRSFEYKMLNYLIQGSAADATKQAIINYDSVRKHGRFLLTVYDEINISCGRAHVKKEMKLLREAMESIKFDVPMITDGKTGPNWSSLEKFVD